MLERLGGACARFRWFVIAGWVVALVLLTIAGEAWGGRPSNGLTLQGASSQEALDLVRSDFPVASRATATVVFQTAPGSSITDRAIETDIAAATAAIFALDDVTAVVPLTDPAAISADGRTTAATVLFDSPSSELADNGIPAFDGLVEAVESHRSDTLSIEVGGVLAATQPIETNELYTLLGLVLALLVLFVVLGTWTSFAWPVVGALAGIAAGLPLLRILQATTDVPGISATAGIMVGLGVGIDYGLFIVSGYKDNIEAGRDPRAAAAHTLSTSGKAVLTAGATVIIALGALFVFQVAAVTAMAYSIVIFVVCVILSATTLVPAILAALGERTAQHRTPLALSVTSDESTRPGARWARLVERRAPLAVGIGAVALVAMSIPVFTGDFRLGPLDLSLYPESSTEYEAWQIQSEAFGAGAPNPFLIVAEIPPDDANTDSQLSALQSALGDTAGVAYVADPRTNEAGTVSILQVIPTTSAQDAATADLVTTIRDDTIPAAVGDTDLEVSVSGVNAVFVDLDQRILDRLPIFIGLVVLIALLVLGTVFRSVLIPVKAAILNLLVIGATYGLTVLVFTEGVGLSLLGVPAEVPILSLLAPVIFAILFGLSNDYEVYLVTRVEEELEAGETPDDAIAHGVGRGAHVVIAAALIMVFVFASYMLQPGTSVVQFGFAMTVAIIIDAFIARMLLLPAILHLGGRRMWWPGRTLTR